MLKLLTYKYKPKQEPAKCRQHAELACPRVTHEGPPENSTVNNNKIKFSGRYRAVSYTHLTLPTIYSV